MRITTTTALSALALTAGLLATAVTPAAATSAAPLGGYVATFETPGDGETGGTEQFRVQLVERADIDKAFQVLYGRSNEHVNGRIVRTTSPYNPGYTWHLDPNDVTFAAISIELCDGLPSYVGQDWWTSERFCPWAGKVVKMERVRG
ncbi:hypothetical protein [Actinoplanes teichomyceticus]|uniref:BP74 N-terminal domain-containing protein n=1 Tax=Actinoplanes teichomyceticus TaxID=1867 RepID=A0A561WLS0_ACTTI|nr:hypothetical protein [Actinoplanes teichomyceticus]TWG24805.1 hypothetical protein FHX34_1021368 [Actinoplanes teichomyceticus]GIF15662.1 hypothetical protein Ate01nite_56940 [Actinoplanes teichomyceticus]